MIVLDPPTDFGVVYGSTEYLADVSVEVDGAGRSAMFVDFLVPGSSRRAIALLDGDATVRVFSGPSLVAEERFEFAGKRRARRRGR